MRVRYSQYLWKHKIYTAKSIADKIDFGSIIMEAKQEDLLALEPVLSTGQVATPTHRITIYKNRRGQHKSATLWCSANLGTCRIHPLFLTDNSYKIIPIEDVKIMVKELEEDNAFNGTEHQFN